MHVHEIRSTRIHAARSATTVIVAAAVVSILGISAARAQKAGDAALGTQPYDKYDNPAACTTCHLDIARQHEQAMMSQAYVHSWDEIEYFELALPHSLQEPKVAGIKAGCNGCHAPFAFLAGDIPPQKPDAGTRANEGVSCDLCHTVSGFEGDVPFNFNWISTPGKVKYGPHADIDSPYHQSKQSAFLGSAEFCGTCHNEKDPWGLYVKATHLEWKEGPHGKAGIVCQNCHMPPAAGKSATMGKERPAIRQHLFHGAHDPGKLAGVIEVRIHPESREAEPGETQRLTAILVNAKAGHKVPTGSAEERVLWLHVEATDAAGKTYHLPVDRKGFEGEDYTIASRATLAYQDIGDIKGLSDFAGLPRDGNVPDGDRIFRLPYLDPKGRMTIAQWNTASFGPDYRLAPLQAVAETFSWKLPGNLPAGEVRVQATVYYSRLVSSVAEYLKVPKEEWEPVLVGRHVTSFTILD